MFLSKIREQTILENSTGDYISATVDSFLIDHQAREAPGTHSGSIERPCTLSLNIAKQTQRGLSARLALIFCRLEKHYPGGDTRYI